jgi:vacuolar-type H+-ATPase subunit C/Vma6
MTTNWDDLNARVAGWRTHLLRRSVLEDLGRRSDLAALASDLAMLEYPTEPGAKGASPRLLEGAVRTLAGRRLAALGRWCGSRVDALAFVFDDEDRWSIRALVRGAAEGVAPERRLAGCLPTPALPLRALETLAAAPGISGIGATLAAWGHPFAGAVLAAGGATEPDLLSFELELARRYATRALTGARRHDLRLLPFVRLAIDLDNIQAALLLAGRRSELEAGAVFLEGGRELSRVPFIAAAESDTRAGAMDCLTNALAAPDLVKLVRDSGLSPTGFLRAALTLRLRRARRIARNDPLGPGPVVSYALALRQEVLALQRIIWGIVLRAGPSPELMAQLA